MPLEDSPLANVIPGRLRAADPSSRLGIARIRDWLENCNAKHSCVKTETPLPTRVLDIAVEVGDTKAIRLVEPQGQSGKYIAVSHCWGRSHRIKTTKATIEQFKSEITYSSLPKTFKHAVVYARELNIRYLWIDTLCIIQDDHLDWEREASKMGWFYKNAYLTIAASSSSDDSSGLFQDMDTRMYDVSYVSSDALCHGRPGLWNTIPDTHIKKNGTYPMFAFNPDNGSAFVVYQTEAGVAKLFLTPEWMPSSTKANPLTYRIGEFGRSYDPLHEEPLSERGWTLQERLLSPRTIHFGSDQMYWECQECLLAEDGAIFSPNCRTVPTIRAVGLWDAVPEAQELSMIDKADRKEYVCSDDDNCSSLSSCDWSWSWKSTWTRIIENYSTRLLTVENDKLPALAGLARSMAERTGDFYQAGLWKSMLPDLLFWKVAVNEPTHMCKDPGHDRLLPPPWKSEVVVPPAYRAPSWSWASVDASVEFGWLRGEGSLTEILECRVELAGSDTFGRVKSGCIKIKVGDLSCAPACKRLASQQIDNVLRHR